MPNGNPAGHLISTLRILTGYRRQQPNRLHLLRSCLLYTSVVFKDMSNGDMFLSKSTVATKETIEFEGETYPLLKIEISNTSHPFYTGKSTLVDTAGRVDKFMSRYGDRKKK